MTKFEDLGLRPEILTAIAELGYENPMPVQEQVIPFMLEQSGDLVALAQTGTGKTAAFGLPLLTLIKPEEKKIQALILSPTRELCIQIAKDLKNYSRLQKGVKVVPVYGGENIVTQLRQLDVAPQILVATPGRLIDLIERGKVNLSDVRYLVLDEADEMLNMGFQEDIEKILQETPAERRTLLFSATMPAEIARISKKYMHDSTEISVGTRNAGAENVDHVYYMVQARQRYLALKRIVDMNPDIYGIVFCRTRQETKEVAEKLMGDGYNADALHGDLSQAQRDTVMSKFRLRHLQLLVATDVAARGLDVSDLTHVINYNLPDDVEIYTHRSGRTGRANKSGVSVSIIHSRERNRIRDIERMIKKTFRQETIPNGIDICKRQLFHLIERMETVDVNSGEIDPFMPHVLSKLEYLSKDEIIRRFVSLEFNRFLDYYKNAEDLNLPEHPTRGGDRREGRSDRSDRPERAGRGERDGGGERRRDGGSKRGQRVRLKLNIGTRENANVRSVLSSINEVTNDKSISIGDIEITQKFTFFDVFADQADKVLDAFAHSGGPLEVTVVETRDRDDKRPFRSDKKQTARSDSRRAKDRSHSRSSERSSRRRDDNSAVVNSEKPWRRKRY
ncbi:MAG TPA: DEAD/DEAH box helicase [Paludibacteraceae bacterium]|nr:DEAD/DEAH box helicase [Paludibacteraceae bacterium]